MLGAHPKTSAPVELHGGRYGPYVKHGDVNATMPDRDQVDTLTLDDALALLAAKSGKPRPPAPRGPPPSRARARAGEGRREDAREEAGDGQGRDGEDRGEARGEGAGRAQGRDDQGRAEGGRQVRGAQAEGIVTRAARVTPVTVAAAGTAPLRRTSVISTRSTACAASPCCSCSACTRPATRPRSRWASTSAAMHFAAIDPAGARLLFWLHASHHGVFLFFVLSGFLIGRMWWPRPTLPYATFAWRRTLRIYPAFLLSFAGSLAFAYASGTWVPPDGPRAARATLLFLNGAPGSGVVPFNIVTWSLFYEMTFYLAFPALALAGARRGAARRRSRCGRAAIAAPIAAVALGADAMVLCWSLLFAGVALAVHEARAARVRRARARAPSWCSRISP